MTEPKVNPYNFVPLGSKPEPSPYPGLHRLAADSFSGALVCDLDVETPLFTAGHREAGKALSFLRQHNSREGRPILQGASLRGMVRAVYEAATHSCLPLADVTAGEGFAALGDHEVCSHSNELCPACRLFGVIYGDEVHARGRVAFSDAVLVKGELRTETVQLPELSSPKPRHFEIYAQDGRKGGAIAGRKLYYHHKPRAGMPPGPRERASDISEYAPPGAEFRFTVTFENLDRDDLSNLWHCLELDPGLGHKLGMAKPLGYGSCVIRLRKKDCRVYCGGGRYQTWQAPALELASLERSPAPFPSALKELLHLDKQRGQVVGYLGYGAYDGVRIDPDGKYRRPAPPPRAPAARLGSVGDALNRAQTNDVGEKPKPLRKDQKIKVEVMAKDGNQYTLRVKDTGQEGLKFKWRVQWKVGDTHKVKVVDLDPDGNVIEVKI